MRRVCLIHASNFLKPTPEELGEKKMFVAGVVLLDVDDFLSRRQ